MKSTLHFIRTQMKKLRQGLCTHQHDAWEPPGAWAKRPQPPWHLNTFSSLTTSSLRWHKILWSPSLQIDRTCSRMKFSALSQGFRGSRRRVRGIPGLVGSSAGRWHLCLGPGCGWNCLELPQGQGVSSLGRRQRPLLSAAALKRTILCLVPDFITWGLCRKTLEILIDDSQTSGAK